MLQRVKRKYLERTYKIFKWENHIDFLEQMAKNCGRLLKGGEPDISSVAKMVLNDWQRGKLPYFVPPIGCMKMPEVKPEDELDVDDTEDVDDEVEETESGDELDEDEEEAMKEESGDDAVEDTDKKVDIADDPLFENVRFAREEMEDKLREKREKAQEVKAAKPKIDLRELVKQDLKKIVSSIDYDDEEKYESGKKISKKTTSTSSATELSDKESTSATSTSSAGPSSEEEIENKSEKTENVDSADKSAKRSKTTDSEGQNKRVKTVAGTFNVSST